jgi:hypothetical protein
VLYRCSVLGPLTGTHCCHHGHGYGTILVPCTLAVPPSTRQPEFVQHGARKLIGCTCQHAGVACGSCVTLGRGVLPAWLLSKMWFACPRLQLLCTSIDIEHCEVVCETGRQVCCKGPYLCNVGRSALAPVVERSST